MTALAVPQFNILKFPLGGAQQELSRVSRMFSGAFRNSFQSAFATPDAAVSSFTPTQLSGLKLWYEPRTLGLTDGTAISTNTDNSGNGWNATATTTARPTFKTNIVNGLAIARYDGTANVMGVNSGAFGITNNVASCTIVCVASSTTVSAGARNLMQIGSGGGSVRIGPLINATAGKLRVQGRRLDANGNQTFDGTLSLSASTFYIFAVQTTWSAATIKAYINGGTADISTTSFQTSGNSDSTNSTFINLGANVTPAQFWSGDMGDQLVYVPALSLSDLNLLGAYLGTTYNLTWTTAV